MGAKQKSTKVRFPIDDKITTLEELKAALADAEAKEEEFAKEAIRDLLDKPFSVKKEERTSGYDVSTIKNPQFAGQIVHDETAIVYASLVIKADFKKKSKWKKAKAFSI